ncbi:hypothetical protein F4809DRAFT_398423 [Biscogniauxia mediterranea]|nr:hypothetical protein F4809DRAFT_398423 [Biscogniauxia mediterranea]
MQVQYSNALYCTMIGGQQQLHAGYTRGARATSRRLAKRTRKKKRKKTCLFRYHLQCWLPHTPRGSVLYGRLYTRKGSRWEPRVDSRYPELVASAHSSDPVRGMPGPGVSQLALWTTSCLDKSTGLSCLNAHLLAPLSPSFLFFCYPRPIRFPYTTRTSISTMMTDYQTGHTHNTLLQRILTAMVLTATIHCIYKFTNACMVIDGKQQRHGNSWSG